jgi:hypothetical protein
VNDSVSDRIGVVGLVDELGERGARIVRRRKIAPREQPVVGVEQAQAQRRRAGVDDEHCVRGH